MHDPDTQLGGPRSRFPETRLSAVEAARGPDARLRAEAMETLIHAYWKPVYKHVRIQWRKSNEDAKDLTQAFFTRVLEKDVLASYDPELGSFRNYLRTCLDGFVANQEQAARRLKRGGGRVLLPLDFESAEGELLRNEPSDPALPADDRFYLEWTRSLFALAVERLRAECEQRGQATRFQLFERYDLAAERGPGLTYEALGAPFGMSAVTVTNQLAAARRDFRRAVLETLREITCSEVEYRAEARRLLGVEVD